MERKTANASRRRNGARGRPPLAGMLRLASLASRIKPVLPEGHMVSLMGKALREARGLGNMEAFEHIYTRGEKEVHAAIFSRLKIPKDGAKLLSLALGGMYRLPEKGALSKLVEKHGAGKVRYWVSMAGRIAGNELPGARYVMGRIRFGSGTGAIAAGKNNHSSIEMIVTDMFVQPLATLSMTAKLLLPQVKAPKRR